MVKNRQDSGTKQQIRQQQQEGEKDQMTTEEIKELDGLETVEKRRQVDWRDGKSKGTGYNGIAGQRNWL